ANAGNVASEKAVCTITDYVSASYRAEMDNAAITRMIVGAINSANIEIYDMSLNDEGLSGMGTTVVVAVVREKSCVIAHVGDSRAYLVNDGINQLTRDHSVVQMLIESGKLTPEEARVHPRKNIITRALGAQEDVMADCCELELQSGETLLICTDGLTNFVENEEILDIFRNNDISRVVDVLVARANHNGGGDNITAVTVTV
ncbi:MAG: serine/threonine-protein phosphatase, partial [Ruminococcaceae bacterium]|nr:serine/threonine-protein phosphatase [Oscillospiraceae bacterium]